MPLVHLFVSLHYNKNVWVWLTIFWAWPVGLPINFAGCGFGPRRRSEKVGAYAISLYYNVTILHAPAVLKTR